MRLGDLLLGQGLVTSEDVELALQRQKQDGGRLGTHLVAMGALTIDKLLTALRGLQEVDATLSMSARTLQHRQTMYGPLHPNSLRARYSYARALLAAGRSGESLKHAEVALAGIRKACGENHDWTGDALQLVADARYAVNSAEQSLETAPAA
jgi:hypothetical protein